MKLGQLVLFLSDAQICLDSTIEGNKTEEDENED